MIGLRMWALAPVLLGLGLLPGAAQAAASSAAVSKSKLAALKAARAKARVGKAKALPDDNEGNVADGGDLTAVEADTAAGPAVSPLASTDFPVEETTAVGSDSGAAATATPADEEEEDTDASLPNPSPAEQPSPLLDDLVQRQKSRERQLRGRLTDLEGETMRLQVKMQDAEKEEAQEVSRANQVAVAMRNATVYMRRDLQTCSLARTRLRNALTNSWRELRRVRKRAAELEEAGRAETAQTEKQASKEKEAVDKFAKMRAQRDNAMLTAQESRKEFNSTLNSLEESQKELAQTRSALDAAMQEVKSLQKVQQNELEKEKKQKALDKKAAVMLHRLTKRLNEEQKELISVKADVTRYEKEASNSSAKADGEKKELDLAHAAAAAEQKEAIEAYKQVGATRAKLTQMEKQLHNALYALNVTRKELAVANGQHQEERLKLNAALNATRTELAAAKGQHQEERSKLNATVTRLTKEQQTKEELNHTFMMAERTAERDEDELKKTRSLLATVTDELRKSKIDLDDVRKQLTDRTEELEDLKKQKTTSDAKGHLVDTEKKLLDATKNELAAKGKEVTVARAALSARNAELKKAQERISELTKQLSANGAASPTTAFSAGGSSAGGSSAGGSSIGSMVPPKGDLKSVEEYSPKLDTWGTEDLLKEELSFTEGAFSSLLQDEAPGATDMAVLAFALQHNTTLGRVCAAFSHTKAANATTTDVATRLMPERSSGGNASREAPKLAQPSVAVGAASRPGNASDARDQGNATVVVNATSRHGNATAVPQAAKVTTAPAAAPVVAHAKPGIVDAGDIQQEGLAAVAKDLMALREASADLRTQEQELGKSDATDVAHVDAVRKDLQRQMQDLQERRAGVITAADIAARVTEQRP